jgi:hypothetical protein
VAQRVGRGIALLFHDRGTRRVSSAPRPHFTPVKDTLPIVQEAGWAPGPVWTDYNVRTVVIYDLEEISIQIYRNYGTDFRCQT